LIQIIASFSVFNISQGSVATHWCMLGSLLTILLQVSYWMCQWKNYENRSILSKDMNKCIVSPFFDSRCTGCGK